MYDEKGYAHVREFRYTWIYGTWYQVPGTSYQVDSLLGLTSEYPTV